MWKLLTDLGASIKRFTAAINGASETIETTNAAARERIGLVEIPPLPTAIEHRVNEPLPNGKRHKIKA